MTFGRKSFAQERTVGVLKDIEFALDIGHVRMTGELTGDNGATTGGLHGLVWAEGTYGDDGWLGPLSGYIDLAMISLGSPTAHSSDFPFVADSAVSLVRSSLSPTVCAFSNGYLQACLGMGYGLLNLTQPAVSNETYGTFLYSFILRHQFRSGLTFGLKTEWNEVEIRVLGNESFIECWNTSALLGFRF